MAVWNSETEAREQIRGMVAQYYKDFKKPQQEKTLQREIGFPMHRESMMNRKCVI